jgi:hypothetical protein
MLIELKLNELKLIEFKLNEFSTWFLAVLAALLDGLEIIFVAFASAVNEFLAGSGRNVVKVTGKKGPAVARLGLLAAAIGAFEPLALAVDEGHLSVIARIGHADGVRWNGQRAWRHSSRQTVGWTLGSGQMRPRARCSRTVSLGEQRTDPRVKESSMGWPVVSTHQLNSPWLCSRA